MIKIPVAEPKFTDMELKYIQRAVKSGWISSKGEFISKFENKFSDFCSCKFGVSTSNGTTALHLALKAIGLEKGDEVIVPTLTFIATANTVVYCNARPIFVDSHPDYWCMDPSTIEKKISKKTKAIIPVHLYGHPCDMDIIMEIAEDHNLFVIEDAAEAHGAEYKTKKVGGIGHIGCFSFYGNKLITTGEGGMCTTNNEELKEKMIILKNHGMNPNKRYWYDTIGFNYRMTNLQAAIGLAQIKKIKEFISIKRRNSEIYTSLLKDIKGIITPPEMDWAKNVYWMYSILLTKNFSINRDQLQKQLMDVGIDTRPLFYPLNTMPPYLNQVNIEKYPVAEYLSKNGINLPSSITLNENDINHIIDHIKIIGTK